MFLRSGRVRALLLAAIAFVATIAPLGLFNSYNPYGFRSERQYVEQFELQQQNDAIGDLIEGLDDDDAAGIGNLIDAIEASDRVPVPGISWQRAVPRGIEHVELPTVAYAPPPADIGDLLDSLGAMSQTHVHEPGINHDAAHGIEHIDGRADHVHVMPASSPVMALFDERDSGIADLIASMDSVATQYDVASLRADRQTECLAKNLYFEASAQDTAGVVAVGHATLNRVSRPEWPGTICEVVYERHDDDRGYECEFEWTCDGISDVPSDYSQYQRMLRIAVKLRLGHYDGMYDADQVYFNSLANPGAWWQSLDCILDVGGHRFYADGRTAGRVASHDATISRLVEHDKARCAPS